MPLEASTRGAKLSIAALIDVQSRAEVGPTVQGT